MKIEQVAAQMYTVRNYLKTPADISSSLQKIKAIGYPAVQASGLGPIEDDDLARRVQDAGLKLCATHEPARQILDDPQAVVARLRRLGCTYTAYPHPAGITFKSLDDVRALARRLNEAGRVLHEAGMVLAYHNHQIEFQRIGGRTILETLFAETNPRYLQGEIDTYWVQYGGQNPAAWCRKLRGRLPLLHLKDFGITPDKQITFCEVGQGNLDWPEIIAEAEASGCRWFIVEQDSTPGDPFESLSRSFDYIRTCLCRE